MCAFEARLLLQFLLSLCRTWVNVHCALHMVQQNSDVNALPCGNNTPLVADRMYQSRTWSQACAISSATLC